MNNPKLIILSIVGTITILAGSFYFGMQYEKSRFLDTPITVTHSINFDSLRNVWLRGKVDSIDLIDANRVIEDLLQRKPVWKTVHDTITLLDERKILAYSTDTSMQMKVSGVAVDQEDTVSTVTTTTLRAKIYYVPSFGAFQVANLSIDPMKFTFKRHRSIVEEKQNDFPISFDATFGFGHGPVAGAFLNYEDWGIGALIIPEEKPLYLIKKRFVF